MKEYSLRDIFALMFSKLWFILICTLLAGIAAFCIAKFVMPLQYDSYTSMYVKNSNAKAEDDNSNVELGDLNASKSLLTTYIAVLKSRTVMDEVGTELLQSLSADEISSVFTVVDGTISASQIGDAFAMSAVDSTEVLKITATTANPEVSKELCRIIADIAPKFLVRVVGAGSVEIIDEASVNTLPVSPNIPKLSLVGLLIGFVFAAALVIALDLFDDTVKSTDFITETFDVSILGEVQDISSGKGKTKVKTKRNGPRNLDGTVLLTSDAIPFNAVESYKTIRSNIVFSLATISKKVFAVSSPNAGEGKSTTASNIAIAFSQTEKKVLLIDGDMRKPVLHRLFKLSNSEGLSTLIIKTAEIDKAISHNVINNLDVLTSGPIPPNPSELLASEQFSALIDELSQIYDIIVIDTPPINVVSDAMVMRDSISGILCTLKYGSTTTADVNEAMKQFELADCRMLGFVLNGVQISSYRKYKYYGKYSRYYRYGSAYENQES